MAIQASERCPSANRTGSIRMLKRTQSAVIDNANASEVLMDAVRPCSLGQTIRALFEVSGAEER